MNPQKPFTSPRPFPSAAAAKLLALFGFSILRCGDGHDCCGSDDSYQPQTRTYFGRRRTRHMGPCALGARPGL